MGVASDDRRVMTADEAEAFVLGLLGDGRKRTTAQIDAATARAGRRCPDATVRFLAKLRLRGKIHGELSLEHRSWLWWHPDHPEAPAPELDEDAG
jgi:hypothetical protein